jgi:ComF family protein
MQWFKSISQGLRLDRLANIAKDALWQANCPLCQRPADGILCKDCDRQISAYQSPDFFQKDDPISSEIPLYSWGIYDGALKRAIAACKYENHPQIMEAIGEKIATTWQRSPHTNAISQKHQKLAIVPIPLHPNKLKSRGFNQAETLARRFAVMNNLPCHPQGLQRTKDTKAQIQTKGSKEREQNLAQAFSVPNTYSSKNSTQTKSVILFDDIYTTGATIREAIATLASKNIAVRGVIVVARTQFRK